MPTTHPESTRNSAPERPGGVPPRVGGIAGHVVAGTYVIGFLVMLAYLAPQGYVTATSSPADSLEFLAGHTAALYAWYLVVYIVGGAALAVLVLALHDRVDRARSGTAALARAFGLIWSGLLLACGMIGLVAQRTILPLAETDQAAAVASWHAVSVIQEGLGGGVEVVGALWVLLTCTAAYAARSLSRPLAVLGTALGIVGLITLAPGLADVAATIFGIGMLIWFTWTATLLSRPPTAATVDDSATARA